MLTISASTTSQADVKVAGSLVHVFLFEGANSELVSLEYVDATSTYQTWSDRPTATPAVLDNGVETATIDIDSQGRMWLAWDRNNAIRVRYSDPPYSAWSSVIPIASGIKDDDIGMVVALPSGKVGVMWSNQATKRFGFRLHTDGDSPTTWSADEVPASQSALSIGAGMADDHLNVAVGSDGTLYAAVKTSYDTVGYPKIALLIRRPDGTWDDLYEVDQHGTRPIVLLDEALGTVSVIFAASEALTSIIYNESSIAAISFGPRYTLIDGTWNNVSSCKERIIGDAVVLASTTSLATGVHLSSPPPQVTVLAPVGSEVWFQESVHDIEWTATGAIGVAFVDLDYSTDGGASWSSIVSGLANTGSYAWTVPDPPTTTARVRVTAHDSAEGVGQGASAGDFEIGALMVSVDPRAGASMTLGPTRPNPFFDRTTIDYALPREGRTRLEVFDVTGRRVRAVVDQTLDAGVHTATWDGRDESGLVVASGLYLVRLDFNGVALVRRVVLSR